jgi:hypothetical protein
MDEMKYLKHDSINPIPQRKNCRWNDAELGERLIALISVLEIGRLILGVMGMLKRVGKCPREETKRRRLRAGATPIHKQAIDENLAIQPPSIDKRSQAEALMPSHPNPRQIIK